MNIRRLTALILVILMCTTQACFGAADVKDNVITVSGELGVDKAGSMLSIEIYAPNKSAADLIGISGNFKDVIIYKDQINADDKGDYSVTFKLNHSDAISGMCKVLVFGDGISKSESFLYTNKNMTETAIGLINDKLSSETDVAELLKTHSYDLGVDDKYFDAELAADTAELLCQYLNSEGKILTLDNERDIVNKAVAVAALNKGKIENIFEEADIFGLSKGVIKDFYNKDYVVESVQKSATDRVARLSPDTCGKFESALAEGFVLAVVENPDGVDNTKSVMNYFSEEIGIEKNGADEQYGFVSNNEYASYAELKKAFNEAKSDTKPGRPSGGGSGGGGGISSGAGDKTFVSNKEDKADSEPTVYPKEIFDDLSDVVWAEDAIVELAENGIINGKGGFKFAPNDSVLREEFVKMVLNAFDIEGDADKVAAFTDVDPSAWYAEYVNRAYSTGVVTGYSDSIFGVGEKITREDMAVIIKRAAEMNGAKFADTEEPSFTFSDDDEISDYATESVYALKAAGVINGIDEENFAPKKFATRAEAAVMIYNVIFK